MAKLVAIGDSITQGFRSLAISDVDLSVPAMLASSLGLDDRSVSGARFQWLRGPPLQLGVDGRQARERTRLRHPTTRVGARGVPRRAHAR